MNATNQLNDLYLGIFSRDEQRVLQAIFRAIADGGTVNVPLALA